MSLIESFLSRLDKVHDRLELVKIEHSLSQEFEKELIRAEKDAKKRSEMRRDFYSKIREIHEETEEVKLDYNAGIKNRVFIAFGDQKYTGPTVTAELDKLNARMKSALRNNARHPVYLDPSGKFYDMNYIPIDIDPKRLEENRGRISLISGDDMNFSSENPDLLEMEFLHNPELYQNQPDPNNFSSFDEYEAAMLQWTEEVEDHLGYLQLPKIMGRQYYRPEVKHEVSQSKNSNLSETWESQLIPIEPKPEFYTKFEDYEAAMLRWNIVCLGLPVLPPHPTQFQTLLGLSAVKKVKTRLEKRNDEDEQELEETDEYFMTEDARDLWEGLYTATRFKLKEIISEFSKKRSEQKNPLGIYHPTSTMVPQIHGTLPQRRTESSSQIRTTRNTLSNNPTNVAEWILLQKSNRDFRSLPVDGNFAMYALEDDFLFHIPLRKYFVVEDYLSGDSYRPSDEEKTLMDDFVNNQIKKSYDCDTVEQGMQVEFKVPPFDLGKIPIQEFQNPTHCLFLRLALERMNHRSRNAPLMSWYHPKVVRNKEEDIKELSQLFQEYIKTGEGLDKVFHSGCFLDLFMNASVAFNNYSTLIRSSHLKNILNLFHTSSDPLVHGKVSWFFKKYLSQKNAGSWISEWIKSRDLDSLYLACKSMTFYDETPFQFYQFPKETLSKSSSTSCLLSTEALEWIQSLLALYYTDILAVCVDETDGVNSILHQSLEILLNSVSTFLEESEFAKTSLWTLASHRTKSISNIGVFCITFLLNLSHVPKISKVLSNINLVQNIKQMASCKWSHVQESVRRLWGFVNERYKSMIITILRDADLVIADLVSSNQTVKNENDDSPSLLSALVLGFLEKILTDKDDFQTTGILQGLIETKFASKTVKEIISAFNNRNVNVGVVMLCKLLSQWIHFCCTNHILELEGEKKKESKGLLSLFAKKDKKETTTTGSDGPKLILSYESDLLPLIQICFEEKRDRKSENAKAELFSSLCELVKTPSILSNILDKEKNFMEKLAQVCKDPNMSTYSWKLLYKMVKYQPTIIKTIRDSGMLMSFLELIGNNSLQYSVTKNSIQYFTKILNLNLKDVKDVKLKESYGLMVTMIGDFIVSKKILHLIHNPYVRYTEKELDGWAFQNMVHFYTTLMENKKLENLLVNFKKDPERVKCLEKIQSLLSK